MTDTDPPISSSQNGSEATEPVFHTFDLVEEALIDAMLLWRRAPDRERAWHTVRSLWPDTRESEHWTLALGGELTIRPEDKPEPRPLPLTRDEVAEMNRVGEWLGLVPEQDRKVVVLAVLALASGKTRVPWSRLLKPMGLKRGAGALAQRYERAVGYLTMRLNGMGEAKAQRLAMRGGAEWREATGKGRGEIT